MNVFHFVDKMDEKYGKDWEIHQISQDEQKEYRKLCEEWEHFMYDTQYADVDNDPET